MSGVDVLPSFDQIEPDLTGEKDMGLVVEPKCGIETVGQMIAALQSFPPDMPIEVGMDYSAHVYRVEPQEDECVDDPRGRVCIGGG